MFAPLDPDPDPLTWLNPYPNHWFLDGQIQLILGPMFSGKSTELIRRLKRYEVAQYKVLIVKYAKVSIVTSVADPDPTPTPDPGPSDPFVLFSGYGSGSGSFYHQAKIVRKTMIPSALWLLFDFISMKNDVDVPSKSNKQKIIFKSYFFGGVLKVNDKNSRIRIRIH